MSLSNDIKKLSIADVFYQACRSIYHPLPRIVPACASIFTTPLKSHSSQAGTVAYNYSFALTSDFL